MKRKLDCIMLIDNNPDDNFYHTRIIQKTDPSVFVLVMASATEALAYLESADLQKTKPDLIFLDINMPGMNGWDFMQRFQMQKNEPFTPLIIMLTTSENPDDRKKALVSGAIADFMTKPLTIHMLTAIKERHFSLYSDI